MVLASPKNKGANGELEAARLLTGWAALVGVNLSLERNLEQVRSGGADITGVPGMEIEVKRQENLNIPTWWKQVNAAADRTNKQPLLMWRQNRGKWNFMTTTHIAIWGYNSAVTVKLDIVLTEDNAREWFKYYIWSNRDAV
jgi:hypothetical protein